MGDALKAIPGMKKRQSLHLIHDDTKMSISENAKNESQKVPDIKPCIKRRQSINIEIASNVLSDDDDIGSDQPLISKDLQFDTPGNERPITFIKPVGVKSQAPLYPNVKNIQEHPHFHPLIHGGEDPQDQKEETQVIHGENEEDADNPESDFNQSDMMQTLQMSMDRNYNDLKDIKRALYSLKSRNSRHNVRAKRKNVSKNNEEWKQWRTKKKRMQYK